MVMIFSLENLTCGYGSKAVVSRISCQVRDGEILCILGPNGVGKTTLFQSILGLQPLLGGNVQIDGADICRWNARKRAQYLGYVPQAHTPTFPYTVTDGVVMGRVSRYGLFSAPGRADYEAVLAVMRKLGIEYLRDCVYTQISGGERQMVLIARALAQNPKILLMDEPTANLDFGNQARVLSHICSLAKSGICVIMTTHNPEQALQTSAKVLLLQRNDIHQLGSAREIVTPALMAKTYGIEVAMTYDENGRIKGCMPMINCNSKRE